MIVEKYTDEQAVYIIQGEANNKRSVMVGGSVVCVKEALSSIDAEQFKRVVAIINAQKVQQPTGDEDVDVLLNNFNHNTVGNSPGRPSLAESTPPRILGQPPRRPFHNRDDNDHDDEGIDDLLMSVVPVDGNGSGDGGNGGGDDGDGRPGAAIRRYGEDREDGSAYIGEFTLVNSRNFDVKRFSPESGSNSCYMEFNDNQREFVNIKGKHGMTFDKVLTWAENRGDRPIIDDISAKFEEKITNIWEYNRAIQAALRNWIEGDANKLVKYGSNGGTDAWRRLYAEYIPLAQTKQDIILTEIMDMKPVNDKNARKLLNRVEEFQYKYNQCGGQPVGNNIVKRVMMRCLPRDVTKPSVLHLDTATTFQQIRKLVMGQFHYGMTGMLEGDSTQLLDHVKQDTHSEPQAEDQPLQFDLESAE